MIKKFTLKSRLFLLAQRPWHCIALLCVHQKLLHLIVSLPVALLDPRSNGVLSVLELPHCDQ